MAGTERNSPSCCEMLWQQLFSAVAMSLLVNVWSGSEAHMFDFNLIMEKQSYLAGSQACKDRGYDGLAVINAPETYAYALELTKSVSPVLLPPSSAHWFSSIRSTTIGGVNLGLVFHAGDSHPTWSDGTSPPSDTPWKENPAAETESSVYGRLNTDGQLTMMDESRRRYSLCGNYDLDLHREIRDTIAHGQQPDNLNMTLRSASGMTFFMRCIALCGKDFSCRAAAFNSQLLTCMTFGPGAYSGLIPNPSMKTFVRMGF
ncbi:hypothetical protein PoB_004280100 [Plakobranchus ocellatus]|uniref:C-type lectin domain-containing protein n=1 Tax=Plakobranchus ocellatus TaxID=259542 RepID=A0AAV4B771_9GAST|nr:hypothetical protein PoB_004280100 [Plakobranchus ocellatus]